MREVILIEPDPRRRAAVKELLGAEGAKVLEARDLAHALQLLPTSRAGALLAPQALLSDHPDQVARLARERPLLDVVGVSSWGAGLLERTRRADQALQLARDAVALLGKLAEQTGGRPALSAAAVRMTELLARRVGLSPLRCEAAGVVAAAAALGPSLVPLLLRGGSPQGAAAAFGVSADLQAALTLAGMLRGGGAIAETLEAVEERFDGQGRPRGLAGEAIPLEARVVRLALTYAREKATGKTDGAISEAARAEAGRELDPKVVDALARALRDEAALSRLDRPSKARVLVADPEQATLALAEMRLSDAGYEVVTCQDGAKAAELAKRSPPNAIVADLALPKLDGTSLLLQLRRDEATKGIPVILLTARADAGAVNKALKLGARDVLPKPIDYALLTPKLDALTAGSAPRPAEGGIQGSLAELSLLDLVQTLALTRRTGRVALTGPQGRAELYLDQGEPVAAFADGAEGIPAFSRMAGWREGTFAVHRGEVPAARNLSVGLQTLLLHAAWQIDEAVRGGTPAS